MTGSICEMTIVYLPIWLRYTLVAKITHNIKKIIRVCAEKDSVILANIASDLGAVSSQL